MSAPILRPTRQPTAEEYLAAVCRQLEEVEQALRDLRLHKSRIRDIQDNINRAIAMAEAALESIMPKTQLIAHSA